MQHVKEDLQMDYAQEDIFNLHQRNMNNHLKDCCIHQTRKDLDI